VIRHAKANCGFCGEAWFGDVNYCPYCGRPSASASAPTATDPPPEADSDSDWLDGSPHALAGDVPSAAGPMRAGAMRQSGTPAGGGAEQPGTGWKRWTKPIALATVLAALVFGVSEFAGTDSDRPGPQGAMPAPGGDAARSGTVGTSAGAAASAPPAPAVSRAEPAPPAQQQAPAPAAAPTPTPAPAPAPAPPARNRSLCSAANEAAGLCTPE
jgi:hypothetical protein